MNFDFSSKLLEKMWDTVVDKGVSALLRPWQMKRENKARLECLRQNELEKIKIENEAKRLQLSLDKNQVIDAEIVPQVERIAAEVVSKKVHEALQEEVSVVKAIAYAGEYIEEKNLEDEKPEEVPSQDWLNKWKKNVSEFSDEEALNMWGRVLAGEFSSPGKFSYKFLEWLNCITPSDAKLVMKLAENVIGNIYFRGENMDDHMPLSYDELLELQELNVLQGGESMGMGMSYLSRKTDAFENVLLNKTTIMRIKHVNPSKKLEIRNVCSLTRIGREAMQLCDVPMNSEMVQKLGVYILGQGFDVSCADISRIEGSKVHFRNERKIELPEMKMNNG